MRGSGQLEFHDREAFTGRSKGRSLTFADNSIFILVSYDAVKLIEETGGAA